MPAPDRPAAAARRARLPALVSLGVALLAAAAFLAGSPPRRVSPVAAAPPATLALAQAWPGAHPVDTLGLLADGTAYTPMFSLDASTSVGTAASTDNRAVRLLIRSATGRPRELQRIPGEENPQFTGFVLVGDQLVWAESTADTSGHAETRIWRAGLHGGTPVSLTADTGDAIFFDSQYDVVAAGGRVYWAAAGTGATTVTEVRSVPVTGGQVAVRGVPGAYSLSAWPWLVSAASGQAGPVDLLNLDSGAKVHVPAAQAELVACSPVWCRVLVLTGTGGPARIDLMHPDGSDRQREAGGQTAAATVDVALADRYDVLSQGQDLLLYDAARKRTVRVAHHAGTVVARNGVLTWSTGDNEALVWHSLDLRTLHP